MQGGGEAHHEADGADGYEDGHGQARLVVGVPHKGHHRAPHARGALLGLGLGLAHDRAPPHTHEVPGCWMPQNRQPTQANRTMAPLIMTNCTMANYGPTYCD